MILRSLLVTTASLAFTSLAIADTSLPLEIEGLLSDKGKTRLRVSGTYVNSERRGVDLDSPIIIETGNNGNFVVVPGIIGEDLTNTDAILSTIGIQHGISAKSEVYGKISALSVDRRTETVTGNVLNSSDSRFNDAWLGINHEFRDNSDKPALLGFAEMQVAEKQQDDSTASGKSFMIGGTTYQRYDPVILSFTGAFKYNLSRKIGNSDIEPGNSLSLSPSVNFAVNDKVTLTSGVNWRMREATKVNGSKQGIRRTRTSLKLGVGYALGKHDTLSFNVRPRVSGENDVQMSIGWTHYLRR